MCMQNIRGSEPPKQETRKTERGQSQYGLAFFFGTEVSPWFDFRVQGSMAYSNKRRTTPTTRYKWKHVQRHWVNTMKILRGIMNMHRTIDIHVVSIHGQTTLIQCGGSTCNKLTTNLGKAYFFCNPIVGGVNQHPFRGVFYPLVL